jgi:hypothetical protein
MLNNGIRAVHPIRASHAKLWLLPWYQQLLLLLLLLLVHGGVRECGARAVHPIRTQVLNQPVNCQHCCCMITRKRCCEDVYASPTHKA